MSVMTTTFLTGLITGNTIFYASSCPQVVFDSSQNYDVHVLHDHAPDLKFSAILTQHDTCIQEKIIYNCMILLVASYWISLISVFTLQKVRKSI